MCACGRKISASAYDDLGEGFNPLNWLDEDAARLAEAIGSSAPVS